MASLFLWLGQDSCDNFTEMSKSRIKSVWQRNVRFFILVGFCVYTVKGSSVFLTGYLEDYPSSSLSSLRHLSMDLILSTEWSESQLSALCFSSPQLELSSLLLWSYLPLTYSQSSVGSYLVTCFTYLNLTLKMPPSSSYLQGFASHRGTLSIPLDTGKFSWPAAHSFALSTGLLLFFPCPCPPPHQGPCWWSLATFASTFPNNSLPLFLSLMSLFFTIILFEGMIWIKKVQNNRCHKELNSQTTGSIFFVRAVCVNSGARVRHGSELQLTQGFIPGHCMERQVGDIWGRRPQERHQCTQCLSFTFPLHVNVCGCFIVELIGRTDYISLLLKEGICRGQQ